MNEPTLGDMAQRMDRLERHNRRLKLAGLLMLMGVTAVIVMGQAGPTKPRILVAEEFVLQDQSGKERARLHTNPDGMAALALSDSNEQLRLFVGVESSGVASINIYGEEKGRMWLQAERLGYLDNEGRSAIEAVVKPEGGASLNIYGKNNQQAWLSPSNFSLLKDDTLYFTTGVKPNGKTTLQMFGEGREEMKLTPFSLVIVDRKGKNRLMAGADR